MASSQTAYRAQNRGRVEALRRMRAEQQALNALEGMRSTRRGRRPVVPPTSDMWDMTLSPEAEQGIGQRASEMLAPSSAGASYLAGIPDFATAIPVVGSAVAGVRSMGEMYADPLEKQLQDALRAAAGEEVYFNRAPQETMRQTRAGPVPSTAPPGPTSAAMDLGLTALDAGTAGMGAANAGVKGIGKAVNLGLDALEARYMKQGALPGLPVADGPADLAAVAAGLPEMRVGMAGMPPDKTAASASELNKRVAAAKAIAGASPQKVRADARKQGIRPTVKNPTNVAYPRIYSNPRELVGAARVAPEDAAMKRLFGVTRDDLYEISQQGTRQGNIIETPYKTAPKPKGAKISQQITTPENTQRMLDIIAEAKKRPELFKGMASWYTMDPLYARFVDIYGPEQAVDEYVRFNTLTGMASPGAEVMVEMNRGTAMNWLDRQGRRDDFVKYAGGGPNGEPIPGTPDDMLAIQGHPYHRTSHARPMVKYLETGTPDMGSAKVPSYIAASGVPETGFQTRFPVGDAHYARLIGAPDARNLSNAGGKTAPNVQSASVSEMVGLTPWWRDKVAAESGLEAVPAQAVVWGAGANATGVSSPVGASKLELLSMQIMKAADRLGISPEDARDKIIRGEAHAGMVDPELLAWLGASGLAGALGVPAVMNQMEDQ